MGIFDRFPYSSTHEMNLDFMLGKATEIAESLQEIDTHKEQAEQAATNAAQSAQAAAGSQTAAGTSASQAAQHKADAEDAADRAEAASDLADEAVEQAQTAATTAGTAAQNASTAADGAIASAAAAETRINNLAASLPEDFTELNNEVSDLKSAIDSIITPDYVDISGTQTASTTINNNKKVVEATAAYYTVSYTVSVGDRFILDGSASNNGYVYIYTDNNNDTVDYYPEQNTSGGVKNYSNIETVAPSGAAHVIIASHTNYTAASLKKVIYTVKGMEDVENRLDAIENIVETVPVTENVPSTDITLHNNHYMYDDGTESAEYSTWQYGEYSIQDGVVSVTVTGAAGQNAPLWLLKDATGTVLGYSADSSAVSAKTETVSLATYTGAKKLFVNDKKSGVLSIAIIYNRKEVDGDAVHIDGQSLPDVLDEIRSERSDKLYGKILCCVGDSITYGADMDSDGITNTSRITVYNCNDSGVFSQTLSGFRKTWGWQIADRHDMTFYNGGVSGSTMQNVTDHAGFSAADGRYTKLPDILDYLLIWFGWNDNAYGTLGTIADDDNDSYYGGYNVVLPYLLNKYPYTKIGLIVPFGASAGHREAIRLLGNKWGVAVWDNYQGGTPLYYGKEDSVGVEASVVTANRAKFQALGAHPNFKGHTQLADMIEAWLKGI